MFERITGPFHGYHIVVYACPMGELGNDYLGQFRISVRRPESFGDSACLRHGCCEETSPTAAMALGAAEVRALREIGTMPLLPGKVGRWRLDPPQDIDVVNGKPILFN